MKLQTSYSRGCASQTGGIQLPFKHDLHLDRKAILEGRPETARVTQQAISEVESCLKVEWSPDG